MNPLSFILLWYLIFGTIFALIIWIVIKNSPDGLDNAFYIMINSMSEEEKQKFLDKHGNVPKEQYIKAILIVCVLCWPIILVRMNS